MKISLTKIPAKHPFNNSVYCYFRPLIPIDIGFQERWLSKSLSISGIDSLVDSGADWSMAPLWIADTLKIPSAYRKASKTTGIENKPLTTYHANVQIKVCGKVIETPMAFGETIPYPLLGREDFLTTFILKIDYPDYFELIPRVLLH